MRLVQSWPLRVTRRARPWPVQAGGTMFDGGLPGLAAMCGELGPVACRKDVEAGLAAASPAVAIKPLGDGGGEPASPVSVRF
jgi:hypothetical protein